MLHVVALVGIDGAGKTTQARLLAEWLTAQGTVALYLRNAGGRRWCNRLATGLGLRDAESLFGTSGMLMIEAVLRWLAIARALVWTTLTRRFAVMDRYVWCQYASVTARGRRPGRLLRLLFGVFPAPQLVCYLAMPAEVAQRRVEHRGTDHEELAHLAAMAAAYQEMASEAGFVVVDATGPLDVVQQRLRTVVREHLPALATLGA
jgi:dTMP kinase